MRFPTLLLFVVLALAALFALLNWPAFTATTALSLGVTTVQASLGLIMLGVLFLVGALCLAYVIYLQGSVLVESRRQARELASQRELADKAEASRFTELRQFIGAELERVAQDSSATRAGILARLDEIEQRQRLALEQTGNTLSAYIGELEDRLEHRPSAPAGPRGHM